MAVTVEEQVGVNWGSSFTQPQYNFTKAPAAGDTVYVAWSRDTGAGVPTGVSGLGATWTEAHADTAAGIFVWKGTGATSAGAAVMTFSGTVGGIGGGWTVRGLASTNVALAALTSSPGPTCVGPEQVAGAGQAVFALAAPYFTMTTWPLDPVPYPGWTSLQSGPYSGQAYRVPAVSEVHRVSVSQSSSGNVMRMVQFVVGTNTSGAVAPHPASGALGAFTGTDWKVNAAGSTSVSADAITLINNVGSQSANVISIGVDLPGKKGIITGRLKQSGYADALCFGIVSSSLSKTTTGALYNNQPSFCGLVSDNYNGQLRLYIGGVQVASLALGSVPGGWNLTNGVDISLVYTPSGGTMTVQIQRAGTTLLSGSAADPAFVDASIAAGALTGGLAGVHTLERPVTYALPDITNVTPLATARPANGATLLSSSAVSFASSYEYRIDGGTPVALSGGATRPTLITGLTNGTTYNMQVRAVKAEDSTVTQWSTAVPVTPTSGAGSILHYDDFERVNSTTVVGSPVLGNNYTVSGSRTWGILNGGLYAPGGSGQGLIVADVGSADHAIEATGDVFANDIGIVFRYTDASNFFLFQFLASPDRFAFYRCTGGTYALWDTISRTMLPGDRLQVVARGEYIAMLANGRIVCSVRDSSPSSTATKVGFRNDANGRWGSLVVSVPTPTEFDRTAVQPETRGTPAAPQNTAAVYKGRGTKALDAGSVA